MRKLILTVAMAGATVIAGAQTLTSKNGTPILPETGDLSIGFDAVPVLRTIGSVFHDNLNGQSTGVDYPSNNTMTIVAKMVADENTAYRAKLGINFGSRTSKASTESFNGNDSAFTPSEVTKSNMDITLGAGIQKWRGKGRVRGYYGAEAMIGFGGGSGDSTSTYLRALNTNDIGIQTSEYNAGGSFGVGLNGFLGVEYFFGPKMSLSAEYTWGLALNNTSESETSYSTVDAASGTPTVVSKTSKGGSSSSFLIGVGNTVTPNVTNSSYGSGSIVLSFYF